MRNYVNGKNSLYLKHLYCYYELNAIWNICINVFCGCFIRKKMEMNDQNTLYKNLNPFCIQSFSKIIIIVLNAA